MPGKRRRPPHPSSPAPSFIREMPPEERPRQRLLRSGGEALSDPEVLSLVLGNGCREVCSLELAREILRETSGLPGLVGIRPDSLQRRGLGQAKAASVLASLELARRLARAEIPERDLLDRPAAIVQYLALRYAVRDQEVMGALYLDSRHRLMAEGDVFRGTIVKASVEPPLPLNLLLTVDAKASWRELRVGHLTPAARLKPASRHRDRLQAHHAAPRSRASNFCIVPAETGRSERGPLGFARSIQLLRVGKGAASLRWKPGRAPCHASHARASARRSSPLASASSRSVGTSKPSSRSRSSERPCSSSCSFRLVPSSCSWCSGGTGGVPGEHPPLVAEMSPVPSRLPVELARVAGERRVKSRV